jgi:putative nucleotidyltransferase with HDIG domain
MTTQPGPIKPDAKRIRRVTESIIGLPTLPTVVSKMIDLVDSPRTSAVVLSRLIGSDQSLTAKILKLANSAYYGFSREIPTVNRAIVVLGFGTVKEMGLSLSVFDVFRKTPSSEAFDVRLFWEHSVACGVASQMLARTLCPAFAGEAFVAGLLHDVGKVILKQYFDREFAEVIALQKGANAALDAAEEAILGTTHDRIGAWLAEKWNLPELISDSILHHHDPWEAGTDRLFVACVTLGDYICHMAKKGQSGRLSAPEIDPRLWEVFSVAGITADPAALQNYTTEFLLEYDKAEAWLMLDTLS